MKWNLQWILKQKDYTYDFEDDLKFQSEAFEQVSNLIDVETVHVTGRGRFFPKENRLYVDLNISGTMIVPDAYTNEEVPYPFETESSPVQKEENKPVSTVESKVEPLRDPFANSKSKLMDLDDEPVVEIKKEEPKQQPVVQEKPVQKKQVIKEDTELSKLDKDIKLLQKKMCENRKNEEAFSSLKKEYDSKVIEFETNPIVINYKISEEEVKNYLLQVKNVLEQK